MGQVTACRPGLSSAAGLPADAWPAVSLLQPQLPTLSLSSPSLPTPSDCHSIPKSLNPSEPQFLIPKPKGVTVPTPKHPKHQMRLGVYNC